MSLIPPVNATSPTQKVTPNSHHTAPTKEDTDDYEAKLNGTSKEDPWTAVHSGFNNLFVNNTRQMLAYHDQQMKEIDYGNKSNKT